MHFHHYHAFDNVYLYFWLVGLLFYGCYHNDDNREHVDALERSPLLYEHTLHLELHNNVLNNLG